MLLCGLLLACYFHSCETFPTIVFPHFLTTTEMAFHVLDNFEWHLRGTASPPLPLPDDYQDLCLDFVLLAAQEATYNFLLPEIVEVVFYGMVLNDAKEPGVVSGGVADMLESTLIALQWSTFEV